MRKCKLKRTLKCGHAECGAHCAIFREIGQSTLVPVSAKPVEPPEMQSERLKKAYEKMRKTVHKTGVETTFYKKGKEEKK